MPRLSPASCLFLALGAGCSSAAFIEAVEPPDAVRFLAALAFDPSSGVVLAGSPVVPHQDGWKLSIESEVLDPSAVSVELVGWSESVSPEVLADEPDLGALRPAVECETRVPAPVWRATLSGEVPEGWPALTTGRLASVCPTLAEPGVFEPVHLCGRNYCGQSVHQDGCHIEIRSAGCGLDRTVLRATVDAYGALCFPETEGCRATEAPERVFRRVECDRPDACAIDWLKPSAALPALEVLRRELVRTDPDPTEVSSTQPNDAFNGPLQELLLDAQQVYVLRRGAERAPFGLADLSSSLMVLNPDSLEVEGEFELPAGVGALAWSPDGESLVGVQLSRESSAGALLRLGRDGRVIEVHPFELPPGSDATLATLLRDLPELGVYVLFVSALMGRASILTFDRDSLGLRSACTTNYVAKPTDLLAAASDQVWLSENGGDYLPMVQLSTCNRLGAMAMDTPGNFGMGHFLSKPGEARVLLTLGGVSSNSVVGATLDSGAMLPSRGASFYESFMIPTILAADPTHPGLALAAVHTSRGVEPARVGWFDLESELYLPGAVEVGSGIAARIRTRGDGVFYLLMGRTGGIVRVRTR